MAVAVEKKDLLDAMQKAFPIVPSKSSLLILSNFRMTYVNSTLEILATDADHSLVATAAAAGDGEFDITVPAKKIFEVVRELPEGSITLSLGGDDGLVLLLNTEHGFSCKIAGANASDFPSVPKISKGADFGVGIKALREIIKKSAFAASKDESRASLCGILWELSPEKMGMVATDGHRLGYSFTDINLPVKEKMSRIVSHKSLTTLLRIVEAKTDDETLKVKMNEKYISFETPSWTMVSRLIEGQYPDYEKVIPKNNPKVLVAEREKLLEVMRRVCVLSSSKNRLIKLVFKSGQLEVVVMNRESGSEAREFLPVEYEGEEHVMGFNGQYFIEILDIMGTEKVRVEVGTQIGACLMFPQPDDAANKLSEDLFLLMPLRIVDEV